MNRFLIFSILLLILLTVGAVSASDNLTADDTLNDEIISQTSETQVMENNESFPVIEDASSQMNTKIESHDVTTYYKENSELVSYLKDSNNQPIPNKKVSIFINNRIYDRITDNAGKVVLKLNLKPDTYSVNVRFDGDDDYAASSADVIVKVKKASLTISAADYKTYWHSDLFFKVKVTNKVTKNPVKGVKVAFKVYFSKNKYKIYYATTDANGVAKLKKNFKVGSYKIITSVRNKNVNFKKSKAVLTVKPTAETGCASLYVQVSNSEAVIGFRRDATNAVTLHIVKYKLNGKPTIKQYKKGSYFFHTITSADGWMAGTGGVDNPSINRAIEKIVGKMFKEGKIKKSYLKTIQRYEKRLGIGHFSIKAPNGKYAAVWSSKIKTGKLKPSQYICVPNGKSYFKYGNWVKFSKNPAKAAIRIAAKDPFGVNRRDITAFHWNATTIDGKTNSTLKVYAANDKGNLVGRSTGHLKDNIDFKGIFFSKNRLPKTPSSVLIGVHNFGNIDKLKTQTVVKAPAITKGIMEFKTFDISVKDKKTKNPIKNLQLKVKIGENVFTVKTDSNGIARLDIGSLSAGSYYVIIYSGNANYYVSAQSIIVINGDDVRLISNQINATI